MRYNIVLPLPRVVLHPVTAAIVAVVHVYLAAGHLVELFAGDVQWTHIWKGFGALGGAYVFAALATRGLGADPTAAGATVRKYNLYACDDCPNPSASRFVPVGDKIWRPGHIESVK